MVMQDPPVICEGKVKKLIPVRTVKQARVSPAGSFVSISIGLVMKDISELFFTFLSEYC